MLTLLRQRNFGLLWSAGLISLLGDGALATALPFYVYLRTASALATGTMFIVEVLPALFLSPLVGVFVDRWDRKNIMIASDLTRACVLLLLLIIPSLGWLWLIYVVGLLEAGVSTLFAPARGALLPHLVEEQRLLQANSWSSISDNVVRLVGPVLGGTFLVLLGLSGVVLVDVASYVISALLVASIDVPVSTAEAPAQDQVAEQKRAFWHQWREGLEVLWRDRWFAGLCLIMGTAMFAQGIINVLLVVFAQQVLHSNALTFGWLVSAQGVGGILGGLLVGQFGKIQAPTRLLALSLGTVGIIFLAIINVPFLPLVLGLFVLLGIPVVGWMVSAQTLLQNHTNKAFLGRVLSVFSTTQIALMLCGMGLGSMLGNSLGVTPLLDVAGGSLLLAGIGASLLRGNMGSIIQPVPLQKGSSMLSDT